jgi:hypothetical protein
VFEWSVGVKHGVNIPVTKVDEKIIEILVTKVGEKIIEILVAKMGGKSLRS